MLTLSRYGIGSISATTCPCTTLSCSSTRNRMIRPETTCGATLTMWASTKASSVMEWLRRYSTQLIAGTNPTAISATTAAAASRRPGRNRARRPAAATGLAVGPAWVSTARWRLGRLDCAHGRSACFGLEKFHLMMVDGQGHWRLANSHRIFQAVHRDQITIPSVQVILLGAGQRGLRVGNLGGRGRTLAEPQLHEPVILAGLIDGRAGIVDADPGRDGVPVGLVDLERDLIRDRLGLGHGLTHLRVRHPGRGDPPTALEQRPLEPNEPQPQIDMAIKLLLLQVEQGPVRDDFGCNCARAIRPPAVAISTVR